MRVEPPAAFAGHGCPARGQPERCHPICGRLARRHPATSRWRRLTATALVVAAVVHGCDAGPPETLRDADEAELYRRIIVAAQPELGLPANVTVHPYLAVVRDSAGQPRSQLDEFEYEPSAALRLLEAADSTIATCTPDVQGACATSPYLVLSAMHRLGDRDAVVMVLAIDRADAPRERYLLARLRHRGGEWIVGNVAEAR